MILGLSFSNIKLPPGAHIETIRFPNGDSYTGGVNNEGERNGKGRYVFANGDMYEGTYNFINFQEPRNTPFQYAIWPFNKASSVIM